MSAARGVFERGDWSLSSPAKRKAVLNKLADLMEAHAEELALLETLDTGKPIRHSLRDDIPGAARAIQSPPTYAQVSALQAAGRSFSLLVAEPLGPRNCGQSPACARLADQASRRQPPRKQRQDMCGSFLE